MKHNRLPFHFNYLKKRKLNNTNKSKTIYVDKIDGYQSNQVECFTPDKPLSKLLK